MIFMQGSVEYIRTLYKPKKESGKKNENQLDYSMYDNQVATGSSKPY